MGMECCIWVVSLFMFILDRILFSGSIFFFQFGSSRYISDIGFSTINY